MSTTAAATIQFQKPSINGPKGEDPPANASLLPTTGGARIIQKYSPINHQRARPERQSSKSLHDTPPSPSFRPACAVFNHRTGVVPGRPPHLLRIRAGPAPGHVSGHQPCCAMRERWVVPSRSWSRLLRPARQTLPTKRGRHVGERMLGHPTSRGRSATDRL
jgi:hypothetical protein